MSLQLYEDVVYNHDLSPVNGALISVINNATDTPAALFDINGNSIANPVVTDGNGNFSFYIAPGSYVLTVSGGVTPVSPSFTQNFVVPGAGPTGPAGPAGPTGATGAVGPQGPQGEPVAPYLFTQSVPSTVWVIPHGLGYTPVDVNAADSTNTHVLVETHYDSDDQVSLIFSAPESGTATVSI
jgi:hypothetical protein